MFAEQEAALLLAADPAELETMVRRRVAGEPLEHVLGWVEFFGRRVAIGPGVFVPRPRTEFLVREVAARSGPGAVVLDLCCGSGAVGLALADAIGAAELHSTDLDPAAVACAREDVLNSPSLPNQESPATAPKHARSAIAPSRHVYQGDLFEPLPNKLQGRVDILIAITPYVPHDDIDLLPREARLHEPLSTLDGGADGLDLLRRVLREAGRWLAPTGLLATEVSEQQAATVMHLAAAEGLLAEVIRDEEADATVVIARPGYG